MIVTVLIAPTYSPPSCAGSAACDLWEVDDTPEVLVHGQPGDLNGLAMNPAYPHVFATVSEADTLVVFSALTRKVGVGRPLKALSVHALVLNIVNSGIVCMLAGPITY